MLAHAADFREARDIFSNQVSMCCDKNNDIGGVEVIERTPLGWDSRDVN